jgi:DNA-binding NarL/FixJ family response regulator
MALRTDTKLLQVAVSVERRTDRDRVLTALRHPEIAVAPAGRDPDALVLAAAPAGRDRWPSVAAARESTRAALVCVIDQADWRGVRAIVGQGANAVVLREDVERTLAAAVLAAASGQLVLPSVLAGQIARPALSPREKQVLGMVVMGLRNAEIAQTLYISETTVKSHLAAAFSKLGVRSRSEASALILDPENGLGIGILEISGEGAGTRQAALPGVR